MLLSMKVWMIKSIMSEKKKDFFDKFVKLNDWKNGNK